MSLFLPQNKNLIFDGKNLDLNVELIEFENEIMVVDYILNGQKLGSSQENPFDFQWQNIPEGNHQVVVRAIDSSGTSYYSEPLIISVLNDVRLLQLDYVIGPNPTSNFLNVIFTNLDGNYDFEFKLVSMEGNIQKTFSARPNEAMVTLDVLDLKSGLYILQISAYGMVISNRKFIVNK